MLGLQEPAFPVDSRLMENGDKVYALLAGMSLRDYFAAQALIAMAPSAAQRQLGDTEVAQCAYALADAMMRERENSTRKVNDEDKN